MPSSKYILSYSSVTITVLCGHFAACVCYFLNLFFVILGLIIWRHYSVTCVVYIWDHLMNCCFT